MFGVVNLYLDFLQFLFGLRIHFNIQSISNYFQMEIGNENYLNIVHTCITKLNSTGLEMGPGLQGGVHRVCGGVVLLH